MRWRIVVARSAEKEIVKLDNIIQMRIEKAFDQLAANPRPPGCKRLKNSPFWRIRVGDYRIIYAIDDTVRIISIERVAHRRHVYE